MIFEREFDILLPVLSVLSGARLTLWFAYLFQLKEYRIDRFRDFVRSDDGFRFLFGLPVFGRLVIYGVVGVFCLAVFGALESRVAVTFLFLVELLIAFRKFWRKSFYRPVFTGKALFLLFISLFAEVILGLLISYEPAWVIAWGARFFFMALIFFGSFYPTLLVKKYYILRAKKVMDSYPDLRRIAVTGSYGKTTIKEFLVKTLSQKYKTVAPSKNFNTEIGVAKFILSTDWSGVEIFVVEMGAYQIGDIRVLSEMVSPEVGILTVINEEHLSLFGSLKNTQTAKYELLRALPEHGLAIVNSDNALCREYLYELSCQIETFGYDNEYAPTFLLKEVKSSSDGISVSAVFESENFEIKASVLGEHQAMNLAPVYLVAKKFGFSHDDISRAFSNLSAPEHRQQIMNYGQAIVIDDTYNSNPEGFMSALQTLNHLAKGRRRVVITRGMLELGERSDYLHEKVAGEIAFSADELVIIAPNSSDPLVSGLGERNRVLVKKIYEPVEILQYVKSLKDQKVAILFENRLPSIIAKEIFGHL